MTRRTAIGTGLAFASMACAAGFGANGPAVQRRRAAQSIDALLIDESIEMPHQMAAYILVSRCMLPPVVEIRLDASGHAGLKRLFDKSRIIIGISTGATLFCLERIAWDYGFRLATRSQRCANEPGDDAYRHEVTALLSGSQPPAAAPASLARPYRPSRLDGMLHTWVMQRSASPRLVQAAGT